MESQSTESSFAIRHREPETPVDAPSRPGLQGATWWQQVLYGFYRSTTHCLSTAATMARSLSVLSDTTCDRFSSFAESRWWLLPGLASVVSAVAWSGHAAAIPVSLAFLLLLNCARSRKAVFALATGYYAGATWQIIPGAGAFFGHHATPVQILTLWACTSTLLAAPWALLWSSSANSRVWRVALTLLLLAVPPLGIIGCASPLTSAGILFPGTAWWGLTLMMLTCGLLASYPAAALVLIACVSIPTHVMYEAPAIPSGWQAVSTRFGGVGLDPPSPLEEYTAAQSIQETALESPARIIAFPETVVSNWNAGTDLFWHRTIGALRDQGKTILVGANVFEEDGQHYYNSVILRGANEHPNFVQRIPVPIAMWIPFSNKGVPLRLGGAGTLKIKGKNVAVVICYEHLLIWPIVASFADRPDLLLGTANDYWARHTTVPEIQHTCLDSWARLFGVPLLWAQNT